jgi:ketosteroid isomerase-like protein
MSRKRAASEMQASADRAEPRRCILPGENPWRATLGFEQVRCGKGAWRRIRRDRQGGAMSASAEEVRATVHRYLDGIRSVDQAGIERALETMTDDVVWTNPDSIPQRGRYEGKQAVRELLESAIAEVYEPQSQEKLELTTIVEGNRAVALYDVRSRTTAGREYANHFALEFVVRDGLHAEIRENFDTLLFMNVVYGGVRAT